MEYEEITGLIQKCIHKQFLTGIDLHKSVHMHACVFMFVNV